MYQRQRKNKINKRHRKSRQLSVCCLTGLAAAMLLAGCKIPVVSSLVEGNSTVFKIGSEKCTEKEAKVILLNYQKDYASLYGVDMWSHDYGDGVSLAEYVRDLTVSQLAEVYTLDIIAEDQEVALSEDETAAAEAAATEYMNGLSEAEQEYLDMKESDVQKLFERYALAKKMYSKLTESVSTEVSDDEARVMVMKQISVSDKETADSIVSSLDDGKDFDTVSASYTDNLQSVNVSRTTYDEDVTEELFALDDDEYSDVISMDDSYCVFYCVSAFDEDLTEQNKTNVLNQRMEDAVNTAYASYTEQLASELHEDTWDAVAVDTSLELAGASFMEVYEAYFESF